MNITTEHRTCAKCSKQYKHTFLDIKGQPVSIEGEQPQEMEICEPCWTQSCEEEEEKARMEKYKSRWIEKVPKKYRQTDINHPEYPKKTFHKLAMDWARSSLTPKYDGKTFFGLQGASALCKTRILSQMAKLFISRGYTIQWINSVQFEWCCAHEFDDEHGFDAKNHLRQCLSRDLLVIDDIGALKFTPSVERKLYGILEDRSAKGNTLLWSSNENFDEMAGQSKLTEKQKERLFSRLDGYSNWFSMDEEKN